ncbi:hypothetical protein AALA00_10500 [Lachnospiraceae bacterium 46-15]
MYLIAAVLFLIGGGMVFAGVLERAGGGSRGGDCGSVIFHKPHRRDMGWSKKCAGEF